MTPKTCISCGMPLIKPEDHAAGDESRGWCKHCGDEKGDLKPYDQVLFGMTMWMVQTQGLDEQVAKANAAKMLAQMPAWKDHGDGASA